MAYPRFAVQHAVSKRVFAAIGPLHNHAKHVASVKLVITRKLNSAPQHVFTVVNLTPHVAFDFFPQVDGVVNSGKVTQVQPPMPR